jgi:hypothetical protein
MSPSNGRSDSGGGNGVNYIEHQVSKLDTLAGVAIKYGVEVLFFSFRFMNFPISCLSSFVQLFVVHLIAQRHELFV